MAFQNQTNGNRTTFDHLNTRLVRYSDPTISIFCFLQGITTQPLVRISRQYRSVLRDCQEHLDNQSEKANPHDAKKFQNHSEILYKLELIWNLVEILFIEKTPCKFLSLTVVFIPTSTLNSRFSSIGKPVLCPTALLFIMAHS